MWLGYPALDKKILIRGVRLAEHAFARFPTLRADLRPLGIGRGFVPSDPEQLIAVDFSGLHGHGA